MSKLVQQLYILIGPPAIGKSTWVKKTFGDNPYYVVSRDNIVNQVAESMGMTYNDMFVRPSPEEKIGSVHEKYGEVVPSEPHEMITPTTYKKISNANGFVFSLMKKQERELIGINTPELCHPIAYDMMNPSIAPRSKILKTFADTDEKMYYRIAVDFIFDGIDNVLKTIAKKRFEETGKGIPDSVYDNFYKKYKAPSFVEEKFNKIIFVDNREMLRSIANEC